LFNNLLEAGILFFSYGAVHEVDPQYIQSGSGTFPLGTVATFFLNVAIVEFIWLFWDMTYFVREIGSSGSIWKRLKVPLTSKETGISATRRWTILNSLWTTVMIAMWHLLGCGLWPYSKMIAVLVGTTLVAYASSFLIVMKDYYSGQIASSTVT
jgi:hypothetical protein